MEPFLFWRSADVMKAFFFLVGGGVTSHVIILHKTIILRLGWFFLSGYGCGDHFLESDTFLHSWQILAELLSNRDNMDIMCDIGM